MLLGKLSGVIPSLFVHRTGLLARWVGIRNLARDVCVLLQLVETQLLALVLAHVDSVEEWKVEVKIEKRSRKMLGQGGSREAGVLSVDD